MGMTRKMMVGITITILVGMVKSMMVTELPSNLIPNQTLADWRSIDASDAELNFNKRMINGDFVFNFLVSLNVQKLL